MRSNLSVAPPIDIWCYQAGSLSAAVRVDIRESDPYVAVLRTRFRAGMLELFQRLPDPAWAPEESTAAAE